MQKTLKSFSVILFLGFLFLNPFIINAQGSLADESVSPTSRSLGGLVPCGNDKDTEGNIVNPCDFNYFLFMINKIVKFILVALAMPIAAIAFAYAGFLLLFSGGQSSQREKAKNIFWNTAKGLIFIAASWLIISTILSILEYDDSVGIGF
jgi:hypothetical protein